MSVAEEKLTEKDFVFDDELYACQDVNHEEVEGYIWAMDTLVNRLVKEIKDTISPNEVGPIISTMNNINFYPCYNVKTGKININGSYYYYKTDQDNIESQNIFVISLSDSEKSALISAMENYCQKEYKKSCLAFVNQGRDGIGLLPLLVSDNNTVKDVSLACKIKSASERLITNENCQMNIDLDSIQIMK